MMRVHHMIPIFAAMVLAGCSCQSGIGITGDEDATTATTDAPWDPSIDNMGDPGFGDVTEPWCSTAPATLQSFDVWSDETAVYVFGPYYYTDEGAATVGCPSVHCEGRVAIFCNAGDGWNLLWDRPEDDPTEMVDSWMVGIPSGPLFFKGRGVECALSVIADGIESCALPGGSQITDMFVIRDDLAYAIATDRVVYWNGTSWGPYPAAYTPYTVYSIWADEETIFCAGPEGTVVSLEDEDWRVHDTHTLDDLIDIWGLAANDVWASGASGLIRFDGTTWSPVEWPDPADPSDPCQAQQVVEFWGAEGTLFFHNTSTLVRWDGTGFTVLLHWPRTVFEREDGIFDCTSAPRISSIWGNGPEELFVAVRDPDHVTLDCGEEHLLLFDGSEFHWF